MAMVLLILKINITKRMETTKMALKMENGQAIP